MKPRFLQSKFPLAAVAVLCVFTSFLPTRWAHIWTIPAGALTTILQPATDPLHRLAGAIHPRTAPLLDRSVRPEDYYQLLAYNEQLRQDLEKAKKMVQALSHLSGPTALDAPRFIPARVTAWADTGKNPTLTINKGTHDGVQKDWIVASGESLVGWIGAEPGAVASKVRLITAPRTVLKAKVLPQGNAQPPERPVLVIQAAANGQFVTTDANALDQYQKGDIAYLYDVRYSHDAAGLIIGVVVRIEPDPEDTLARKRLVIQPSQSFAYLSDVIVIVPPGTPGVQAGRAAP